MRMTPEVRTEMLAHAIRGLPNEACGMFSTTTGVQLVDYFHPMRNAAESAKVFVLDPHEMLDLEKAVEGTGRRLAGVMHSHTSTSPYPSPTDMADSARFDPFGTMLHVIVSLQHGDPVLRCYRIASGEITEVPVVLTDGDDDLRDDGGVVAMAAVMPRPNAD